MCPKYSNSKFSLGHLGLSLSLSLSLRVKELEENTGWNLKVIFSKHPSQETCVDPWMNKNCDQINWYLTFKKIISDFLLYRCMQENTAILEELVELRQKVWCNESMYTWKLACDWTFIECCFSLSDGWSPWLPNSCKLHHRGTHTMRF